VRGTPAIAPMDLARRFYSDSLTHSGRSLHCLPETVGYDGVMLGSDYPFNRCDRDPLIEVNSLLSLTQEDNDGIVGGVAASLLKL
jgi:aminocarboxymuconate-semialdehyde decarboxylase